MILLALFLTVADPAPIDWYSICREAERRISELGQREAIKQARERDGMTWAQIAKVRLMCKVRKL